MDNQTPKPGTAQTAQVPESLEHYLSFNMTWDDVKSRLHRVHKNYAIMALVLTHMHRMSDHPAEGDTTPVIGEYIEDIEWLHELAELS